MVYLRDPFRQWSEHLPIINFLKRVAACVLMWDLADEEQHRCAILVCDVNANRTVAGARTTRDHCCSRTAGELAEGIGHIHGTRFKPAGNSLQEPRTHGRCLEQRERPPARDRRDVTDVLVWGHCGLEPVPFVITPSAFGGSGGPRNEE